MKVALTSVGLSLALSGWLFLAEPKMDQDEIFHLTNPDPSAYCFVSEGYYFWHCARDSKPEGMPIDEAVWHLRRFNSHLDPGKLQLGDVINLPLNFNLRKEKSRMRTLKSPKGELVRVDDLIAAKMVEQDGYTYVLKSGAKKKPQTSTAPLAVKEFVKSMKGY